jgi:mannonate dehydratase
MAPQEAVERFSMKLGLGLYRHALTPENFRFARQAGATHIVAHLTDYFRDARIPAAKDDGTGWGFATDEGWTYDDFARLRDSIAAADLKLEALENLSPAIWHDVLLDGPKKKLQLDRVKQIVRDMGKAGIPCLGYNFSLAGVWGHSVGPYARGGAESVGYLGADGPKETPIPNGMVWNMRYDPEARDGDIGLVTSEQMWKRLENFLRELVPVAEDAGVMLAMHPDDPPMPSLRGAARLIHRPEHYQRMLDLVPSKHSGMEFCIGTLAEMPDSDIYQVVDQYSRSGRIGYLHFRNIRGKAPHYVETFVDEGDTDMPRVLRILARNGYDGVLIPDHTPQMSCAAPWHAGMAFAMGFMRAAIVACQQAVQKPENARGLGQ